MANLTSYNIWSFRTGTSCITQPQSDNTTKLASTSYVWNKVPLTTKGDLLSSNGTINQRLGVGTSGQILFPNSSTTTGLSWSNFIIDISSTTTFTTASTTDVVVTNMNLTPGVGLYMCMFNGSVVNNTNNVLMSISMYVNGVIVTGSTKVFRNASVQNQIPFTFVFPITVTVAGHVVDIRAKTSAGTMTITNRYMALIRESN